jgi:hypothetical protein
MDFRVTMGYQFLESITLVNDVQLIEINIHGRAKPIQLNKGYAVSPHPVLSNTSRLGALFLTKVPACGAHTHHGIGICEQVYNRSSYCTVLSLELLIPHS